MRLGAASVIKAAFLQRVNPGQGQACGQTNYLRETFENAFAVEIHSLTSKYCGGISCSSANGYDDQIVQHELNIIFGHIYTELLMIFLVLEFSEVIVNIVMITLVNFFPANL